MGFFHDHRPDSVFDLGIADSELHVFGFKTRTISVLKIENLNIGQLLTEDLLFELKLAI